MTTDEFDAPATSSGIQWKEINGALLLFAVNGLEPEIVTSLGTKPAIRANVTVLDGPNAGEFYDDALVFPRALIGQLRPKIGGKVLGRLGTGLAKPGQNAPWVLAEASDAEKATARAYLAKHADPPF